MPEVATMLWPDSERAEVRVNIANSSAAASYKAVDRGEQTSDRPLSTMVQVDDPARDIA